MTLNEYIQNLIDLRNQDSNFGDMLVVTSKDDEGNGYNLVYYTPSVGEYISEDGGEFHTDSEEPNAICVN